MHLFYANGIVLALCALLIALLLRVPVIQKQADLAA